MTFETLGSQSNPASLFFHAMGVTGASSRPVADQLRDRYFCVLPTSTVYCAGQTYVSKADEVWQVEAFLHSHGVSTLALGMCFSALYFRCRNLWAVAAVHGFMDFCALLSSGVFRADSMTDIIGSYSAANMLAFGLYAVIALVLLRPSKLREITSRQHSEVSVTAWLGLSTGLVGFLVGAVFVWCCLKQI